MAATVTLSSVGTSAYIALDYLAAKATTVAVSFGSTTMGATFTVQATLEDPMWVTSPRWIQTSTVAYTSAFIDSGVFESIASPIAAVRLSASSLSSSNLTLRALQNAGG